VEAGWSSPAEPSSRVATWSAPGPHAAGARGAGGRATRRQAAAPRRPGRRGRRAPACHAGDGPLRSRLRQVTVPVIDISGERRQVVDQIGRACREIGFLTVVGHGVPDGLVEGTAGVSRTFFDLPDEEKRRLAEGEPQPGLPAYRPLRSESLAASLGQRTPGDLKDAPGGLQVQTRGGDWLEVEAVTGSFVVNLGDMMARWTNDHWPATLHRVAVPPADRRLGSRRQTIVFFHDPRADAVIECIPGCSDENDPPRYEPVTALEHVLAKAAKAQKA